LTGKRGGAGDGGGGVILNSCNVIFFLKNAIDNSANLCYLQAVILKEE
jgi:hypothetical protein